MADDFKIAKLSDELEDAGWLGLSAAGFLSTFIFANGTQGNLSTTDTDIVWTKTIDTGAGEQSFDFGIGKLIIEGGLFSAQAGVHLENNKPTHISTLFSFFQDAGGHSKIYLELDHDTAYFADKEKQGDLVIGYKTETEKQTVRIELPLSAGLEFNFELNEDNDIISSVQFYESLTGLSDVAKGILELDLNDKVLVLPWLLDAGLVIDKLFLDLTETGATNFSSMYPEVYNPAWKGIGAKEIDIIIPIDKSNKEFIIAGIDGFLYGFDGLFSGKANLTYASTNDEHLLKSISGEVEIRNNEIIKSELSAVWNLQKATEQINNGTSSANAETQTDNQNDIINKVRNQTNEQSDNLVDFNGDLKTQITLIRNETAEKTVWGADITMEAISVNNADSGLEFNGILANALLWTLGGGFGVYSFVKGIKNDEASPTVAGLGLMFLAIADAGAHLANNPAFLPRLEQLAIPKLTYRFIAIQEELNTVYFHKILLDARVKMKLDSTIMKLFTAISDLGMSASNNPSGLFDNEADKLEIKGDLEIDFKNIALQIKKSDGNIEFTTETPEDIRHLFEEKDLHISAKKLPEIILRDNETSNSSSDFPKPIVAFEFIKKDTSPDKKYGLAIHLKGLGNSSFAVNTPAVGIVLFFWPEFDFEWSAQLAIEPKFTFVIPKVVYAEGIFDLNKPIPSFEGTQSKISVDVGVVYSGPAVSAENMEPLFKIKNYNYQFGGEFVWGEATNTSGPAIGTKYDFLFVEVHYEGKTPLFAIGPVAVFGLGGLFGRNIAPGNTSGDNSAMGIANWIHGSGNGSFNNVKNWPSVPAADGSTWHPSRDFENDKDKFAIGLFVKAGSAVDQGKTISVDSVLMVGFPEFWIALAGYAVLKPISAKLAVVIVYDHPSKTFAIKAVFTYKIKEDDGKIILVKAPFEFGTGPDKFWIYLGHYLSSKGGPVEAKIFNIFSVKAYNAFDTEGFNDFGLTPNDDFEKPNIPGPAYGQGGMWQIGPKTYGPSFLNVQLFAALGYNIAVGFDPFLIFGELFAMGYIRLKVFFFKFKISLAARLYGLASPSYYRFMGELKISISLPWPFDDINASVDFEIESGNDDVLLTEPLLETSAVSLARLESKSIELNDQDRTVPIDAIIALKFNKPILEIINAPEAGVEKTQLTIEEPESNNGIYLETTTSNIDEDTYNIEFKHVLDHIKITKQDIGGSNKTTITEKAATWEPPAQYNEDDENSSDDKVEQHHVIYINSLINPELQFQKEELGKFYNSRITNSYVSPCSRPTHICIFNRKIKPEVENTGDKKHITFDSALGDSIIRELEYSPIYFNNTPLQELRLQWSNNMLVLPQRSRLNPPDSTKVTCDFLMVGGVSNAKVVSGIYIFFFYVKLRGVAEKIAIPITLISDLNSKCGFKTASVGIPSNPELLKVEIPLPDVVCETKGQLRFKISFEAKTFSALIDYIEVQGPHNISVLRQNNNGMAVDDFASTNFSVFSNSSNMFEFVKNINNYNSFAYLLLSEMCFEQKHNQHSHWEQTCVAGCDNGNPITNQQGIESIWDNMMMEPNKEYSITYKVSSHGTATITGTNSDKLDALSKTFTKESDDDLNNEDNNFKTIKFKTEATPTQDVTKYVGFSFPMPGMQPLYTNSFLPLISLKYHGLIEKIYHKYYGPNKLKTKLVDINDNEITKRKTTTLNLGSLPTDSALEELVASCLPQAQNMTHVKLDIFERNLLPDTFYSLQLEDSSKSKVSIPYTASFKTSKFKHLEAHVKSYQSLWETPTQLPALDHDTVETSLINIINPVILGNASGFDNAIEKLYQQILGINGGRLAQLYGSKNDLVAQLVSKDNIGQLHVWGHIMEFSEPLLTKEGVHLKNLKTGTETLKDKGIYITKINTQNRLILVDHSGSRMVILNSTNGTNFNTIQTDSVVEFEFSLENALKQAIFQYIETTFIHYTDAEKDTETLKVLQETKNLEGLDNLLTIQEQKLTIPVL